VLYFIRIITIKFHNPLAGVAVLQYSRVWNLGFSTLSTYNKMRIGNPTALLYPGRVAPGCRQTVLDRAFGGAREQL
jgi:hypothetical protein